MTSSALSLVSIIVPVYNTEKYLEEALISCLQQTYPTIEVIAVDNNSTDRSREILNKYAHMHPDIIKVFDEKKPGAPAARNKGIEEARGKYLHFLDADDVLKEKAIELLLYEMTNEIDAVSGGEVYYQNEFCGSPEYERLRINNIDFQLADILYNHPNTGSLLLKRSALGKVRWDNNLGAGQELVFWSELVLNNNINIHYIPEIVCKIRIHQSPQRISNQNRKEKAFNMYLAILKIEMLLKYSPYKSPLGIIALNDFKLRHAFKAINARNFKVSNLLSASVNKQLISKSKDFSWFSKEGVTRVSNHYVGFFFYYFNYKIIGSVLNYFSSLNLNFK